VPLPGWLYAGEPYGCAPDLALGPKGEALISSDVVPVLWRVDPETLAVTQHTPWLDADADKDIGFTALAFSREQDAPDEARRKPVSDGISLTSSVVSASTSSTWRLTLQRGSEQHQRPYVRCRPRVRRRRGWSADAQEAIQSHGRTASAEAKRREIPRIVDRGG